MKASLSVFVPVHNAQAQIASILSELLEILPDLTARFELAIIDDGSTDATPEIAHEAALLYPQTHLVAHPARWGQAAAVRSGLSHSSGDLVLLRNERTSLSATCLAGLWQVFAGHEVAMARPAATAPLGRIPKAPGGRPIESRPDDFGWCLMRRRLLEAWRREASGDDWMGFVLNHARRVAQLQVRPRAATRPAAAPHVAARRPNYLARLREFAWGE